MGQIQDIMAVSTLGIVLQIALDAVLIPCMGITAVTISNCLVYLVMGVYLLLVFIRKYFREPEWDERHGGEE